ncbi:MAG: hypothetical protein ACE5HP_11635 [Gemmatimonadota bacterium]
MRSRRRGPTTLGLPACLLFLVPLSLSALGGAELDEPYLSIRTGLRCSQCHVNRTGGGGRNDFGSMYAQTRLAMTKFAFFNRSLNRFIKVGGNFRVLASGTTSESTPRTEMGIREESVQLEARVIEERLAFYVDQIVGPSSSFTREAFLLIEKLPLDGYLKAGKFLLPYGLRLVDDAEFIRERTGFNYNTPDQGVEVGIEPAPLSLFAAVTNGTQGGGENNSGKQITTSAALIFPRARFGASASRNDAPGTRRDVVGGFGGFGLGRFVFLGEFDYIFDKPREGLSRGQFAAYLEGDFLAVPGLNLKATYGYLDPDRRIGENARTRFRLGLETFPIQFLEVSAFYTLLEDIPQATTDLDRLSLELHVFF